MKKNVTQRLNTLCTTIENVQGVLQGLETELDGLRADFGMAPHFRDEDGEEPEDEDGDDDDEKKVPTLTLPKPKKVFLIRGFTISKPGTKSVSQKCYLRKGPVKLAGVWKWWTKVKAEAQQFPTYTAARNMVSEITKGDAYEGIRHTTVISHMLNS